MKLIQAIEKLNAWAANDRTVFSKHALKKLFLNDNPKAFDKSLERLIQHKILTRACRNIYVITHTAKQDAYLIERIARALRPNAYSYVSLESALSEYGAISQIPIDRLTIMTTGRAGIFQTPFGVIEMTHTKQTISSILNNTLAAEAHPLRFATKETALKDLKHVGRNLNLLIEEQDDE